MLPVMTNIHRSAEYRMEVGTGNWGQSRVAGQIGRSQNLLEKWNHGDCDFLLKGVIFEEGKRGNSLFPSLTKRTKMKHMTILLLAVLVAFLTAQTGVAQSVKMNEIFARGVAGNLDWIELYNPSTSAVNIGTYKIYDIGGESGTKPKKPFPAGASIPARGFYVIITDTASFPGDLSGFGLSNTGEKVWLQDSVSGALIDTITYGATATATQSYARIPDGGTWQVTSTITRGVSNGGTAVGDPLSLLQEFSLQQNYPNPFNPFTTIEFIMPTSGVVRVQVFDMLGREVATLVNEALDAGLHKVQFDGGGLSSGVYYYKLSAGSLTRTKALTLLK
jgi:hypothetical protein